MPRCKLFEPCSRIFEGAGIPMPKKCFDDDLAIAECKLRIDAVKRKKSRKVKNDASLY